jgi:hypothetical protein
MDDEAQWGMSNCVSAMASQSEQILNEASEIKKNI